MKLSPETIAKLEPLTRNTVAFVALRDLVDAMVSEKASKRDAAANAALLNPEARAVGLIAVGAYAQAQELQQLLLQISGKQNNTEEK